MKKIDDSVFEALFRQAIIDEYNEEIDSIPPKEELIKTIIFSPDFELRMKRLFAREKRKGYYKKALSYSKRVAAAFVITTTIIFGMLLFNPEVRAAVKNTVVEWYDKFTSFIFQSEASDTNKNMEWQPEYLPTGYHENFIEKLGKSTNVEYADPQGNIVYLSYRPEENDTNISVDNENHKIESETINGQVAYILRATSEEFENGVIWSMEGYTFSLWSKLSVDELVKIAQSIYY
jgi:hypothetical protein